MLSGCSMIDLLAAAGVFDAPTLLILSKTKSTLSVLYVLFVEDRRRLLVLLGAVIVCDVRRAVDMIYYIGVAISCYQLSDRLLVL